MKKFIIGALAALALCLGLAAPASATPTTVADEQFITMLSQHGIQANGSEGLAHDICAKLDAGYTVLSQAQRVYAMTDRTMTKEKSVWFVAAAITAYCPWNTPPEVLNPSQGPGETA